nr:hypothetical protein [Tanacetum cinerariifolium]
QGTNSYEFVLANKKYVVDAEVFRKILNICLRVEGEEFTEVQDYDDTLTFLINLGYKGPLHKHPNMDEEMKDVDTVEFGNKEGEMNMADDAEKETTEQNKGDEELAKNAVVILKEMPVILITSFEQSVSSRKGNEVSLLLDMTKMLSMELSIEVSNYSYGTSQNNKFSKQSVYSIKKILIVVSEIIRNMEREIIRNMERLVGARKPEKDTD